MNSPDIVSAAKDYQTRGWVTVPLHPQDKIPVHNGWQKRTLGDCHPETDFVGGKNVGVLLGTPSNGLVDIDLDCPEAIKMAPDFLPETELKFGRDSAPKSHWLYQVDDTGSTKKFSCPQNGTLVEYRSTGGQTMFPPSVHPEGETVEFDTSVGAPLQMDREQLLKAVGQLAAASLIAKFWVEGSRHNLALALSGWLLRSDWSDEGVNRFILAICEATGDEETKDRLTCVDTTLASLSSGTPTTGWPTLAELIDDRSAMQISEWLGLDSHTPAIGHNNPPQDNDPLSLSDIDMAKHFVNDHSYELIYCEEKDCWYHWKGNRWAEDKALAIDGLAEQTVRNVVGSLAVKKRNEVGAIGNKQRMRGMVDQARHQLAKSLDAFDTSPMLLNCENGTVDLRTGVLQDHSPDDLLTQVANVSFDPEAKCPKFLEFIDQIMGGDEELKKYLQMAIGYALTGDNSEQAFFIAYGDGQNGKSTLLNTIMELLGDYAIQGTTQTFLANVKRSSGPNPDIARLKGARLVLASEPDDGEKLSEGLVKQISGGERIAARHLHKDMIEFKPVCKFWLQTNHLPKISGSDEGIWRRVHVIPFSISIPEPERDMQMSQKLALELPGILNWAIEGCLAWQKEGKLTKPQAVIAAIANYREDSDGVGKFVEDCLVKEERSDVPKGEVLGDYNLWASNEGYPELTHSEFSPRLKKLGLQEGRTNAKGRVWKGVRRKNEMEGLEEELKRQELK